MEPSQIDIEAIAKTIVDGALKVHRELGPGLLESAYDQVLPVHEAQLLTYLKLRNCRLGFLINWNVKLIKDGIKRMVNKL